MGETVVVTGSGRGIGKAIARRYLELGASVYLAEVDQSYGQAAMEELSSLGEVHFVPTDVSNEHSVAQMVAYVGARCRKIDVLINNAGIAINKPLEELSLPEWNAVIGVNLTGAFLCIKHSLPLLRLGLNKAIVNIASTRAFMSEPNTEAYTATKGGLVSLTHGLAVSLGKDGIRVNCISPGWINTSSEPLREVDHTQHPVRRVGRPEDIAEACLFLTSDHAGFITGANFTIDGGMTIKMIYQE